MNSPPCSPEKPIEIKEPNLLLTEGLDAYWFYVWALRAYCLTGFQVINFGGNAELPTRLEALKGATGFEKFARAVVVVRDAETSASGAIDSVRHAFKNADLPVPEKPFEIAAGKPKTAFVLFPGVDETGKLIPNGTLENLCLATAGNMPILDCADSFLSCCSEAGADMRHRHKMRLHAYLAGHDKFVGKKIGQAAQAGAWDWDHSRMKPFKHLLCDL